MNFQPVSESVNLFGVGLSSENSNKYRYILALVKRNYPIMEIAQQYGLITVFHIILIVPQSFSAFNLVTIGKMRYLNLVIKYNQK